MKPSLAGLAEQNTSEVSLYNDNQADIKLIATELRKLKAAFPQLDNEFISVATERMVANDFTEKRTKDAIGNLIDNFKYPRPTIADIVGFDKRIRLYTHNEYSHEILSRQANGGDFRDHWIGEKLFRVKEAECIRYNFKPNEKRP